MQYCSLQHQTLHSPSDTSTAEHWFCFDPAASFLLELLVIVLHSSPVAYWTFFNLGAHLPVSYLFTFSYCPWSGLPFPCPVDHDSSELLTMTKPSWVALHGMTHSFIELCKPLHHAVILKGDMVFCCCSAAKSCPILCNSMDYSTPGFLVLHYSFRSMTIESVMLSNHLFLCHLLLLCLQSFPASVFFSNESALGTRWPMDCSFSISLPNEYSGLISFSIDWFDLFAVQGTLKSLLQQRSLVCHIKFL